MPRNDALNWPDPVEVLAPADRTTTATSAAIDLQPYAGNVAVLLHVALGTGTTPTLDAKVQHCDSSGGSYADITGAAFTQVTGAAGAGVQKLMLNTRSIYRYIKLVATIAGTSPHFLSSAGLLAEPEWPTAV